MRVTITTVGKRFYDGEAYALIAPGSEGEMTILSEHQPLVSRLKKGTLRVLKTKDAQPEEFPIEQGLLETAKEHVTVLL
ncbi:MAG: F0F1 ATP synthase subunit epsilon [Candidatus Paceibacterota bacterium]